jgi:hypothetical protein
MDQVTKLWNFRKERERFAAKATVGDLLIMYPILPILSRLDKQERKLFIEAQVAIDDSQFQFFKQIARILPPWSRIKHDPRFLPKDL